MSTEFPESLYRNNTAYYIRRGFVREENITRESAPLWEILAVCQPLSPINVLLGIFVKGSSFAIAVLHLLDYRIDEFINNMINTKKYNNCLEFIKFLGVNQNKDNIEKLMAKMSNKRDASKAADYVKRLNLDPKNYPALGERLYKNTARHFLSKHGWEAA